MRMKQGSKTVEQRSEGDINAPAAAVEAGTIVTKPQRRISWEILGEVILLLVVAGFCAYLFADSMGWTGRRVWPLGSAITPWLALGLTTPFLILRIIHVVRLGLWVRPAMGGAGGQILDVGFRLGENPKEEARRFVWIIAAILALYLGIWLLGFHITVPLWVFAYMFWFGRSSFVLSASMAIGFEILVWGIYDYALDSPWNEPLILKALGWYD
jgi:hypothetical protein